MFLVFMEGKGQGWNKIANLKSEWGFITLSGIVFFQKRVK